MIFAPTSIPQTNKKCFFIPKTIARLTDCCAEVRSTTSAGCCIGTLSTSQGGCDAVLPILACVCVCVCVCVWCVCVCVMLDIKGGSRGSGSRAS